MPDDASTPARGHTQLQLEKIFTEGKPLIDKAYQAMVAAINHNRKEILPNWSEAVQYKYEGTGMEADFKESFILFQKPELGTKEIALISIAKEQVSAIIHRALWKKNPALMDADYPNQLYPADAEYSDIEKTALINLVKIGLDAAKREYLENNTGLQP